MAVPGAAAGPVTRPLGGVIFGRFGDRVGRKTMIVMTPRITGVATFLIGLPPTCAQIGVALPDGPLVSAAKVPLPPEAGPCIR